MLRVVDEDSDRRSLDADPETILKSQWVARAAPRAARIVSEHVKKIEQDDDRNRDADQPGEDASHGENSVWPFRWANAGKGLPVPRPPAS